MSAPTAPSSTSPVATPASQTSSTQEPIPPHRLSLVSLARALQERQLTVRTVAESHLAHIKERDHIGAWAYIDEELVLREADRLDALPHDDEVRKSGLFGVPVGVKDVFYTKDMPTQFGSERYKGHFAPIDASVVSLLRQVGALILGKTKTYEFALSSVNPGTVNPVDPTRSPGDSSCGSAASVADFQVPLALGTQTRGSTVAPASYCGIAAWKVTKSAIGHGGMLSICPSLDTLSFFTRSPEELAHVAKSLHILALDTASSATDEEVEEKEASTAVDGKKLRIGALKLDEWDTGTDDAKAAFSQALSALEASSDIHISDVNLSSIFESAASKARKIQMKEFSISFEHEMLKGPDGIHYDQKKSFVDAGKAVSWDEYRDCRKVLQDCKDEIEKLCKEESFDALVIMSSARIAPLLEDISSSAGTQGIWTAMQLPLVSLPGFAGAHNMPVGICLIGKEWHDAELIAVAEKVNEVFLASGGWRSPL